VMIPESNDIFFIIFWERPIEWTIKVEASDLACYSLASSEQPFTVSPSPPIGILAPYYSTPGTSALELSWLFIGGLAFSVGYPFVSKRHEPHETSWGSINVSDKRNRKKEERKEQARGS